jgi:hypothetical protein
VWCLASTSYDPDAPAIHPISSCSLAWQWVLCCLLFVTAMGGAVRHRCHTPCRCHCCGYALLRHRPLCRCHCCGCALSSSPVSFHPSSTPRAVVRGAGGRWCVVLGLRGFGVSADIIVRSSWWGPGAGPHPCGAVVFIRRPCSGGNGQWSWNSVECVSVMWRTYGGLLGAYQPLPASPGVPLHTPSQCRQPHILFERGGGGLGSCGRVLCFFVDVGYYQ